MDIKKISKEYDVRHMTEDDIDIIYNLLRGNPQFYRYCPPVLTKDSIVNDLVALPPGVTFENKFYIGFFSNEKLIAVLDIIFEYPDSDTVFIGLFMVDKNEQGRGTGSGIISEIESFIKEEGFKKIRLAYAKGNVQSFSFWKKNGFFETGEVFDNDEYTAIIMERNL